MPSLNVHCRPWPRQQSVPPALSLSSALPLLTDTVAFLNFLDFCDSIRSRSDNSFEARWRSTCIVKPITGKASHLFPELKTSPLWHGKGGGVTSYLPWFWVRVCGWSPRTPPHSYTRLSRKTWPIHILFEWKDTPFIYLSNKNEKQCIIA